MLSQLTINNYAIVDYLDITLSPGMTVITGETGAGKSIMLDALGLTLGDRADREVIREGAERADIAASFNIATNPGALNWLQNHDFDADEKECLLRRVITSEGRSRAYINGQQTTLNELRELGELLIDIHSQHEHQSLLRSTTHQRLLDEYAGLQVLANEVAESAQLWRTQQQQLDTLQRQSQDQQERLELLTFQVEELNQLGLEDDEPNKLEAEHQRLHHAGSAIELIHQSLLLCSESDDFNLQHGLNQTLQLLQQIPVRDRYAEEAIQLLENARIQVEEASTAINHSLNSFDLDPTRLEVVEERISVIHQLARKHRVRATELTTLHQQLSEELEQMSDGGATLEQRQKALDAMAAKWHKSADSLSDKRRSAARQLAKEVNAHLQSLGMPGASLEIALHQQNSGSPISSGHEKTEFLVSTNPGQSPRPLIKIASGGELSRISLAIQVATAHTSAISSLVFDEVDVGIGGGVARTVGSLLRQLGDKGQVICVTHQPQVASQGHHHLHVSKAGDQQATSTRIIQLKADEKVVEIARMLGGDSLSEESLAHARELVG